MLEAPQDCLLKCVQPSDDSDSGRYAIAKTDISPGELVLAAAPYAVALNPNQAPSAMYVVARVEEWENISEAAGGETKSSKRVKKMEKLPPSRGIGEYLPVTPCVTFCCSCFRRISTGTLFLNYKSIKELSDEITKEHVILEEKRWLKAKKEEMQVGLCDSSCDDSACIKDDKARKADMQRKPTGSTRMRSKKYLALKQMLSETANAQRWKAVHEDQMTAMQLKREEPLSWPERVEEEEKGFELSEDTLNRGVCGCTGCGVTVYCSKTCWLEFHKSHRATGACQTLRRVYPSLMKVFLMRGDVGGAKAISRKENSLDSWSVKNWLRRTGEDTAWEMQLLLFAALVVARCAKEGYATHMAEATRTNLSTEDAQYNVGYGREATCPFPCIDHISAPPTGDSDRCGGAPISGVGVSPPEVSIATDSAVPREVETIRVARLRSSVMVEILDPKVEMCNQDVDATQVASEKENYWVSLNDHVVQSILSDKEGATHAIRNPNWLDTAKLVTNLSVLSKESKSAFRQYYRRFCKLVLPWLSEDDEKSNPLTISSSFFDRLCAAIQCNNFGIFNANGDCVGVALYPEASYFNHSCLPNICRVMCRGRLAAFYALREIQEGEPLTICYVDVHEQSTAERRRDLLASYRFFCHCDRCSGATSTTTAGVKLCDACVAEGYLIPVPPSDTRCWRMDAVQEGECSICHHRVAWSSD